MEGGEGNLFHDCLEVARFHRVDCATSIVQVRVSRLHILDVSEDFVVAKEAIAGVNDFHCCFWPRYQSSKDFEVLKRSFAGWISLTDELEWERWRERA